VRGAAAVMRTIANDDARESSGEDAARRGSRSRLAESARTASVGGQASRRPFSTSEGPGRRGVDFRRRFRWTADRAEAGPSRTIARRFQACV